MIGEIIARHRELLNKMVFKELLKKNDHLIQVNFDPEDYLSWIKSLQGQAKTAEEPAGNLLLSLDSEIDIYDRRLFFYKYGDKSNSCSLKVHKGEIVYLKAPSGTGKTTVAKIALGLLRAYCP